MENSNSKLNEIMNDFFSLNPYEYAVLSVFIGIVLSYNLNSNQQNSLGNFVENIGQTILTIGAQNQLLNQQTITQDQLNDALDKIKKKFKSLDKLIEELQNYIAKI